MYEYNTINKSQHYTKIMLYCSNVITACVNQSSVHPTSNSRYNFSLSEYNRSLCNAENLHGTHFINFFHLVSAPNKNSTKMTTENSAAVWSYSQGLVWRPSD